MVVCPSCGSSRIRNDYNPAPFFMRVAGIRALLCDYCNHQFRAFSLREPKRSLPPVATRKADVFNPAPAVDLNQLKSKVAENKPVDKKKDAPRKISLKNLNRTGDQFPPVNGELVFPRPRDLRTRITSLYEQRISQGGVLKDGSLSEVSNLADDAPIRETTCPECNSADVKRRPRKTIERIFFSITDHKAFQCLSCGTSFYAKPLKGGAGSEMVNSIS